GDVPGVTWRVVDIRDPLLPGRLSGVDVAVNLDLEPSPAADPRERRTHNVRGAQTVATAAAAARRPRLVPVPSPTVYGTAPDHAGPLPEDAPPLAAGAASIAGDFLEIEELPATAPATHPGLDVTVVRPAALAGPGVDTVVTRHFEAPRLLTVKGAEPA